MKNPNMSSELDYEIMKSRKRQRSVKKLVKNIAKFSLISKCYFPFYKNKFFFSAWSIFFPYSQHFKVQIKMVFEGVRFFYPCTYCITYNTSRGDQSALFMRIYRN